MAGKRLTYAASGVDINKKSSAVNSILGTLLYNRKGFGSPVKGLSGHYAGLASFGDYALALCTDGVGTKLMVAESTGKWKTIGIDCIAMNVNDCICIGAEPIAFVDYIAIDKPNDAIVSDIGMGLNEGARQANITIIGGETAVLPELVNGIDLSGTALGYVKKDEIISGDRIKDGDLLIGLESSGIHSNGYTLARRVFKEAGIGYSDKLFGTKKLGDVLLEPTIIYVRGVMELIRRIDVTGMANITGGGLRNLIRLKKGMEFRLTNPIKPNPVFSIMQELGNIEEREMYQTFNMGMGYCISVREKDAPTALKVIRKHYRAQIVGEVVTNKVTCATVPDKGLWYEKY